MNRVLYANYVKQLNILQIYSTSYLIKLIDLETKEIKNSYLKFPNKEKTIRQEVVQRFLVVVRLGVFQKKISNIFRSSPSSLAAPTPLVNKIDRFEHIRTKIVIPCCILDHWCRCPGMLFNVSKTVRSSLFQQMYQGSSINDVCC